MPELPEVETVRRGLDRYLPGQRLEQLVLRRDDLRWPIPKRACKGLVGRTCVATSRRSKYLGLHFDGPGTPIALFHLGMSGRMWIDLVAPEARRPEFQKHEHVRLDFGDRILRFADPRRFGMLDVVPTAGYATHPLIRDLGPEPLEVGFDASYLFAQSRRRKVATKQWLMDAKQVVGVGNIYASEACFRAGVRPRRAAGRLTRAECGRLVTAVREVLQEAIEAGGTTLRDHIGVEENTGYFQRQLRVYDRKGSPCLVCTSPIKQTVDGGRSTYYCPTCQR